MKQFLRSLAMTVSILSALVILAALIMALHRPMMPAAQFEFWARLFLGGVIAGTIGLTVLDATDGLGS